MPLADDGLRERVDAAYEEWVARAIADVDGDRAGARDVMQERNRTEWSVLAGFLWWLHNPRMRRSATSARSVVTLRSRRTGSMARRVGRFAEW